MSERVKGEPVALAWALPKDQALTYKISPKPGTMFNADSIGEQLMLLAKLLTETSDKDSPDVKWMTGISAAYTHADGSISFDLVIMPHGPAIAPQSGGAE